VLCERKNFPYISTGVIMSFRIISAVLALTLVVACSSKDKTETGGLGADGMGAGSANSDSKYAAGSQEELIATVGDRVFFTVNSSALTDTAQTTLRRQAEWMKSNGNVNVTIEGHADERGTREFNLALGARRASAVQEFMNSLGVEGGRVKTISYGKEHPEVLGSDEASWSKNRRSVTVVD
jgi:peptidoglycan-associated lipoprotein